MGKNNKINASIGNPYIRDESEMEKYRELQQWLDDNVENVTIHLRPEKLVCEFFGKRSFPYPKKVTFQWITAKALFTFNR